ncbi:MAG: hypothetical protein KBT03_04750 [Bacteroidales bacterium]|nr:hypothetical protein [Candidatus Scybalousia scybalohippi]
MTEELRDFGEWFEQVVELKKEMLEMKEYDNGLSVYEDDYLQTNEKTFEMAAKYTDAVVTSTLIKGLNGEEREQLSFVYKGLEILTLKRGNEENV